MKDSKATILVEWRFYDDGTIEPLIEIIGSLPVPEVANSQVELANGVIVSAFWRLDIDIGASGDDDIVEQIEVLDTDENRQREASVSMIEAETARVVSPNSKRSWRVRAGALTNEDGHIISYQLEARNVGHGMVDAATEPWYQHQLYVTVLNSCERLATQNALDLPQNDSCAESVVEFVNGESLIGEDPVLWYATRAYFESPILATNESHNNAMSFQLIPRDWSFVNPLVK